jgi:hypothetical protein
MPDTRNAHVAEPFRSTLNGFEDVMARVATPAPRFAPHHSFDAPLYLVMRDYGRHGFEGVAYPETSKRNIIEDIQSGQIDRVVAVIEIFEGRSRDITDDIREAVEAQQREAA